MIRNFNENYTQLLRGHMLYKYPNINLNYLTLLESEVLNNPNKFLLGLDIIPIGTPVVNSYQTIYAGRSILTNDTSVEQKLKTDSFIHQESFTTCSKVIEGFSLGVSASAKFGFNVQIANIETSISVNTNYNFSSEKAESSTITKTITIPSQEIIIPANTSVEVVAYFNKGTAVGNVNLNAVLKGMDKYKFKYTDPSTGNVKIYDAGIELAHLLAFNKYNGADYGFDNLIISSTDTSGNRLYAKGIGEYSCDAANQFKVSITPVNGKGRKTGETRIIDVDPIIE